ncbi:hypothetical protein Lesp02_33600 [Lentzea sp. NBRC 105346]|uniref:SRPBCC family protein n=1 Tax=Lentzea sp. NBRC 105346 TaxID=3032205 RepID=UPI00249FCE2B|nr:SRPBCC family protein [Lentzea sp. NBRC 105346]GLZ31172.1 hypothetical protein Lesp02_33600 [Lentzea sp. NBRC 105346]
MSETLTLKARAQAPLERVHRALTDAGELRAWLAEHAAVELPGTYGFWGRYTPEGDAPHQRPLHVDDHTVRVAWLLDGVETVLEFSLASLDGETIISLSQTGFPGWHEAARATTIRGVLHTFWALSLANLVDHVEGRPLTPRADFTASEMRAVVDIGAAPADVFDALTDPEKFSRWFGTEIGIEPFVGGRFAMGGLENDPSPAKIVSFAPGRSLVASWDEGGMVASWELAGSGGGTRVTFVQNGFGPAHFGSWLGWLAGFAELRRFLEYADWRSLFVTVPLGVE